MSEDGGGRTAAWGGDTGFAASKFAPAPLPAGHLARVRLHGLLDEARHRPLTVVSAPAGAGKSVLLSEWTAAPGDAASSWLGLDAQDNDPRRFWAGVCTASGVEVPVELDGAAALEALTSASCAAPRLLVLDDVHELRGPEALQALEMLVDLAPPWQHLVLAGRGRPQLPLHRHRARDRLAEVHAGELAFTRAEVAALAVAAELQLTDDQLDRLVAQTEGWGVGVRLGLAGAARSPDPDAFLVGFDGTDPHVADHLRRELLDGLPAEVAGALWSLAPFEGIDGGLCALVVGRADGESVLRRLADAHVFVSECADAPGTFRIHPMLRSLLRRDLEAAHPGALAEAHGRAARWFESHGADLQAIDEWSRAGRRDQAARIVDTQFPELYDAGSRDLMMEWSGKGSVASGEDPDALLDHATRLAVGCADTECLDVLQRVEFRLSVDPDDASITRAMALRSLVRFFQGHLSAAAGLSEEVARRMSSADPDVRDRLSVKLDVRHAELWGALASTWLERYDDAHRALERYSRTVAPDVMGDRFRRSVVAALAVAEGRIDEGARLAGGVLEELRGFGDSHHVALVALCTHGRALLERDELAQAEVLLERACTSGAPRPWSPPYVAAQLDLASVRFARGDRDEAVELVVRARTGAEPNLTPSMAAWIDARYTGLMLRSGAVDAAGQSAQRMSSDPTSELLAANLLLARSDVAGAEALLASVPAATPRLAVGHSLARAHIAWLGQRSSEARQQFAAAVDAASGLGLLRTVVEAGPHVEPLLTRIPDRADGFVARARAATQGEMRLLAEVYAGASDLSHRELEILGYLPTGMTNREIADELFISGNTMKTHVADIYRKLGATSRQDAVRRARALGLLL